MLWIYAITKNPYLYILVIFFGSVYHFTTTPYLRLKGTYKYYSPMLLVFMPSNDKYDIHNGTSFDYLFVMLGTKPGRSWRNKLLRYYLEGLLNIVEEIELEAIPDSVLVRGSSYFFGERTVKKLGFSVREISKDEKPNFYFLYLDLTLMYSLAKGKLAFPKLNRVKTAEISGADLCKQKAYLQKLYAYLKKE